jgi:hypothetical protein
LQGWRGYGRHAAAAQGHGRLREHRGFRRGRYRLPRTDNFDAAADSGDQLIVHGIDGAFGWQMAIHNGSPAASITFASADSVITGFGTCTNK